MISKSVKLFLIMTTSNQVLTTVLNSITPIISSCYSNGTFNVTCLTSATTINNINTAVNQSVAAQLQSISQSLNLTAGSTSYLGLSAALTNLGEAVTGAYPTCAAAEQVQGQISDITGCISTSASVVQAENALSQWLVPLNSVAQTTTTQGTTSSSKLSKTAWIIIAIVIVIILIALGIGLYFLLRKSQHTL